MVSLITLAALLEPQDRTPAIRSPRTISATDIPRLAGLYAHACADGDAHPNIGKALARIHAVFDGTHGTPITEASLFTADADGQMIASIITTDRPLGEHGYKTAFIAELFTHPDRRRQGLAEELLKHAMQALREAGHQTLAVTVGSDNSAAIAFYLSRGFRRLATL